MPGRNGRTHGVGRPHDDVPAPGPGPVLTRRERPVPRGLHAGPLSGLGGRRPAARVPGRRRGEDRSGWRCTRIPTAPWSRGRGAGPSGCPASSPASSPSTSTVRGSRPSAQRIPWSRRSRPHYPGLRPVCFHSPYEAACWAVLSQRHGRVSAAPSSSASRSDSGTPLVEGVDLWAFPFPDRLPEVAADPLSGSSSPGCDRSQTRLEGGSTPTG